MESPFGQYESEAWPYKFRVTLRLYNIAGGVPSNQDTAEAWLRSKVQGTDERIRQMALETMAERGISLDQALEEINRNKHLNGFKRDENGLYIEGRQVKAAIKEAASVAAASGKLALTKWGKTNKYIQSFTAEHIMVVEDKIYLGRQEADGVAQSFPENKRVGQRGIQMTEFCEDVEITFTVMADWDFSEKEWAMIWLTGAEQGLGASRSQGWGRYSHDIGWEQIKD